MQDSHFCLTIIIQTSGRCFDTIHIYKQALEKLRLKQNQGPVLRSLHLDQGGEGLGCVAHARGMEVLQPVVEQVCRIGTRVAAHVVEQRLTSVGRRGGRPRRLQRALRFHRLRQKFCNLSADQQYCKHKRLIPVLEEPQFLCTMVIPCTIAELVEDA